MKRILFGLFGIIILLPVFAQNKIIKDPGAQSRSVSGFHAIKVSTGIVLLLTQGNEEAVAVSAAKPEDRDRIITTVENGVLKIYYENNAGISFTTNNKRLRAYVSCKMLDVLKVSSGALVEVDGTLKSTDLSLDFSSGSGFKGDVAVSSLKIDQGSGSTATISGTANNLVAEASSGSSLNAYDLKSEQCDVRVSSGAGLDISVLKELKASAHSGGRISYRGPGLISSIDTGSGGSVSKE